MIGSHPALSARSRRSRLAAVLATLSLVFALVLSGCIPLPATATPTPTTAASTPSPTEEPSPAVTDTPTPTPYDMPPPSITIAPTVAGGVEDDFAKHLATLPKNDLGSGAKAISAYLARIGPVVGTANLEACFGAYVAFLYDLGFTLMDEKFTALDAAWRADSAKFEADLALAGLHAIPVEGSFVLEPDFQVIQTTLTSVLSPVGNQYCLMMAILGEKQPIAQGSYIHTPLLEIGNMLADWDSLVDRLGGTFYPVADTKYKGHYRAQEIQRRLRVYFLAYDIATDPLMFDSEGRLTQAFRFAYSEFLANHPDSSSASLISFYVAALEGNDWKKGTEATGVLDAAGIQYMSTMGYGS